MQCHGGFVRLSRQRSVFHHDNRLVLSMNPSALVKTGPISLEHSNTQARKPPANGSNPGGGYPTFTLS